MWGIFLRRVGCFGKLYPQIKLFQFCILFPCSWTLLTGKTVLAHDWQTSPLCRIKHLLFKNSYTEWHPFYLFQCSIVCFVWFFFFNGFYYERAMLTVMRSEVLDRLFYWVKYRRGYCWRIDFVDYLSAGTSNVKQECNLPGKKKKEDSTRWPNWLSLHSPCHLKALGGTKGREDGEKSQ